MSKIITESVNMLNSRPSDINLKTPPSNEYKDFVPGDDIKVVMSAHQPNFMPYLGFFDKMVKSDVFVIRDDVLYIANDYHSRNKIRINGNNNLLNPTFKWLNVPVHKESNYIRFVRIKNEISRQGMKWNEHVLHDLRVNYAHNKNFNRYYDKLANIFSNEYDLLIDLNMALINFLKQSFDLKTKIIMASSLGLKPDHYEKSDASEDLARISEAVRANVYLSGAGGKNYLNVVPFEKRGIKVALQEYKHPSYQQSFPGFLPYMSSVDALFCTDNPFLPDMISNQVEEQPAQKFSSIYDFSMGKSSNPLQLDGIGISKRSE